MANNQIYFEDIQEFSNLLAGLDQKFVELIFYGCCCVQPNKLFNRRPYEIYGDDEEIIQTYLIEELASIIIDNVGITDFRLLIESINLWIEKWEDELE